MDSEDGAYFGSKSLDTLENRTATGFPCYTDILAYRPALNVGHYRPDSETHLNDGPLLVLPLYHM